MEAAVSLLEGADKITNREIRAGQRRAKQLTDAVQRLGGIEKDLKHRVNKMDMGYAKEAPKVRQQLAKIQAAQEKVNKMRDQNLKFRKEVEGPLRDKLKKANESLEALASEIRRQESPAREMQLSNFKSLVRNVTEIRKRLNEGPGFSPDLGGKGGEPINVSKLYESLKIDL